MKYRVFRKKCVFHNPQQPIPRLWIAARGLQNSRRNASEQTVNYFIRRDYFGGDRGFVDLQRSNFIFFSSHWTSVFFCKLLLNGASYETLIKFLWAGATMCNQVSLPVGLRDVVRNNESNRGALQTTLTMSKKYFFFTATFDRGGKLYR